MTVAVPMCKVYLGGIQAKIPDVDGAVQLTYNIGQPIVSGTIQVISSQIEPVLKTPVVVQWGYQGQPLVYAFTGFVTNPALQSYPKHYTLTVQDVLFLANFPVQDEINLLNDLTAKEAITILLRDWSGIPEERIIIPEMEIAPGVPWLLGQLTPILFTGMSPLAACQQICTPLGYWLYCDAAGYVRAVRVQGAPVNSYSFAYEAGVNLFLSAPPTVDRDMEQVYNRVVVTGANTGYDGVQIKDEWRVDRTDLLPHGKDRVFTYGNSLIEYTSIELGGAASCEGVAATLVKEHSRDPFTVNVGGAAANPYKVFVGATVGFRDARVQVPETKPFFVMGFARTFGGGKFRDTGIVLDGGVGPDGYTTQPDPIPVFTYKLARETLNEQSVVEVFLDGGPSYGMGDSEVISWVWSDNYVPQHNATGKFAMFMYPYDPALTSVQVTLLVTDIHGKSAEITQTVNLRTSNQGPIVTRVLNFAAGNGWYVTPDGGATWFKESGQDALAVPPISAGGDVNAPPDAMTTMGLIATGTDGDTLRNTIDYLATPSTALGGVTGDISFIWQNEVNPLRVWATSTSGLWLSTNGGASFEHKSLPELPDGEPDTQMRWVVEAYNQENLIDVLAGRYQLTSFDGGNTYIESLEGPAGSTARCYASGHERHWTGFIDVMALASPLRSAEGGIAAFPEVDPPVTGVRALTMLVEEPIMYAFDQVGRIWKLDVVDGGNVEHVATMPDA